MADADGTPAATELDADWVIHTDADEFWLPAEGTLADALHAIASRYGVVVAPAPSSWAARTARGPLPSDHGAGVARPDSSPRSRIRAVPDVVVLDRGGHDVAVAGPGGDVAETVRPPGRPVTARSVIRSGGNAAPPEQDARLSGRPVAAANPALPGAVLRAVQATDRDAIFEGRFPDWGRFKRLRETYEEGRFEELYADLVLDEAAVEEGIRERPTRA